jgi:hypothetical protein
MKGKIICPLMIFLLFFFVSSEAREGQKPEWKGSINKEGDVTVVKNPKDPIYKGPIIAFKEDYSVGGTGAAGDYTFLDPRDIAIDKDGNIYVLDLRESCIKVFDPSAKFLRKISRRGQGPGELGGPFSMTLLLEKGEILINDISNSRLTVFNTAGAYIKQIPLHGFTQVKVDRSENIYGWVDNFGPGVRQDILKKMNSDMSRVIIAEVVSHPVDDSRSPFKPRDCWVLDDSDRLIYGNAKNYEIQYFNPEGKLFRRVLRDYEPLKVTTQDMGEFESRKTPPGIVMSRKTINYSTHHAAYRSFFIDDQGHLFVQTWERTPDNRQDIHDIFDADGRYIGRVALNRHADLINPKPRLIRSGKYYAIEQDKEGYEVVKRYSVTWKY